MRFFLTLLISAGLSIVIPPSFTALKEEYINQNIVALLDPTNPNSGGTGFVVRTRSGARVTITNKHVCGLADKGKLLADQNGKRQPVKVLAKADKDDLCIVEPYMAAPGLTIAETSYINERISIHGHPLLAPVTVTYGKLQDRQDVSVAIDRVAEASECPAGTEARDAFWFVYCIESYDSIVTDATSYPGNSGSPVIDIFGRVVGVVFAADTRSNKAIIVPLDRLQQLIQSYQQAKK